MESEGYVERPDTRDVQEEDLFCYRDAARVCDSTCMAYLVAAPEGQDYEGQSWSRCHLLVNEHRQGKHLVVLASFASDFMKHARIKAADATRAANSGVGR